MRIKVNFYSYFKDLTGCTQFEQELPEGSTIETLLRRLYGHFPKLESMRQSTLIAVGVEYQPRDYELRENDEISLFPPVQGG